jgi:hypothetical protein
VVDRVSWPVFLLASLLLFLTLIDGMFTLALLDQGFEEANPLLSYLLERDTVLFLVIKYILTAIFLPIALVLNQYRLFGTRLRVGHLVSIVVALYLALIAYQTTLWQTRVEPERGRRCNQTSRADQRSSIGLGSPGLVSRA